MSFLNKPLFRNVDSFFLGLFRFVFRAFMLIEMMYYLKSDFLKDLEIYCNIKTGFNGKPKQLIIDPSIDLTKALYSLFVANTGIMPLKEYSNE